MRPISFLTTFVIILSVFLVTVYSSCKKEQYTYVNKCADVLCENNGTCIDGNCSCTLGYTGERCENKANTAYIGKWQVTQKVTSSNKKENVGSEKTYDIEISESPESVTTIDIKGFFGEPDAIIKGKVSYKIGTEEQDGAIVETFVIATPSNFVFEKYQRIGNTNIQIIIGEGAINSLGTQLGADFSVTYPDKDMGVIDEQVNISAIYIN